MKVFCVTILMNALLCTFCFGQQADTTIFTITEVMPAFKYDTCSSGINSVKRYFMDNYKMPSVLTDNGYTGRIYVEFIVERDGSLSNIKLIRGIDEPLNRSILETLKTMPKWIPGMNNGKTVRTRFVLPVSVRWLYGRDDSL